MAMKDKAIYLVRHGELQGEDGGRRFIGQLDLPLTAEGIRQAEALRRFFADRPFDAVYCSDLIRARQTADIVAGSDRPVFPCRELREIALGKWEGMPFVVVRRDHPRAFAERGWDIAGYRPPGGESFADCRARMLPAFEAIVRSPFASVLMVGHAGVNRIILCHVLGMPLANIFRLGQDYGRVSLIRRRRDGFVAEYINLPVDAADAR